MRKWENSFERYDLTHNGLFSPMDSLNISNKYLARSLIGVSEVTVITFNYFSGEVFFIRTTDKAFIKNL